MASKQVMALYQLWQPTTVSHLPLILATITTLAIVSYYVKVWYRLRQFQGPWLASFSEAWLFKASVMGELHLNLHEVNQKYGDLVRIGPNWLMTSDPDSVRYMSAAKHKHGKSSWYLPLKPDPYVHSVFSETNIDNHDRRRALMQSGFSLKENWDLGSKIDAFGYLTQDKDVYGFIKIVNQELPLATLCSSTPTLGQIVFGSGLVSLVGPSPKDAEGRGKLMGVAQVLVGTRFGPDKIEQDNDMLGSFLRNGLTQREAESELLATIMAGSDTTATAIRATMLHVMTSPQVYKTLVTEIQTAVRTGSISSPITSAESSQMPYLQAVIKEGLRIHPPITGLPTKLVNPGGEFIKGRFVPGGTGIGHCGWGIQRHEVFGKDVDFFRPERWLEASEVRRKEMERTMELVFGSGRWECLGKAIVLVELDKIFVELLRRFDFALMNPTKPWKSRNYTLFLQHGMWVRVTKRDEVGAQEG